MPKLNFKITLLPKTFKTFIMKKFLLTVCLLCGIMSFTPVFAGNSITTISGIESNSTPKKDTHLSLNKMKVKQIENLLGRKLKFKEKLALKLYKWKEKSQIKTGEGAESKKGKTAMILGIIALGVLVIPYVAIASIPLAILAIVFGNQAKRADPTDGQAKAGVILGWVALGLIVLAILVVVAYVAAFTI